MVRLKFRGKTIALRRTWQQRKDQRPKTKAQKPKTKNQRQKQKVEPAQTAELTNNVIKVQTLLLIESIVN